jgi:hypothetical protein
MNFKLHLEYGVFGLKTLGGDYGTCYFPDCGYEIPEEFSNAFRNDVKRHSAAGIDALANFHNDIVAHSQWTAWGLNTFEPTVSLTAGLTMTTPSKEPGLPPFPYPTFFVRIPPGFIPMCYEDGRPNPKWAEGMIVTQLKTAGSDSPLPHIFILLLGPGDDLQGHPEIKTPILIAESEIISAAEYVKQDDEFWNDTRRAASKEYTENVPFESDFYEKVTFVELDKYDVTERLVIRLVANLCSWLESEGGLLAKKPSNSHHGKKHNKPGWESIHEKTRISQWILGQEVKLSPELIASAKEHVLALVAGEKRGGWHLHALHTVRGHMQRIPYGKGRLERKTMWIKPYPRGPKDGDVAAHIYRAKEAEPV